MLGAANTERCPPAPPAWYLFGPSGRIDRGPYSGDYLGRRLVGYRTSAGQAVVMDAHCAHLAADLGRGAVVGDNLRCPFHHWQYGPDGICREIPAQFEIPQFARQRVYPVAERHGLVFFFNGPRPLFELPFFFECDPDEFRAGKPFHFVSNCPWQMLIANGFDEQHFQAVHDRRLLRPPQVDCPAPFARRVRMQSEIVGDSIFDRMLCRFVGRFVDVSITSWGGPLVLVTGFFAKARSYILIASRPLGTNSTLTEVIVLMRRSQNRLVGPWLDRTSLALRRIFTKGFLQDDIDRLDGIRLNPHSLVASDEMLSNFLTWLASLPRAVRAESSSAIESPEQRDEQSPWIACDEVRADQQPVDSRQR